MPLALAFFMSVGAQTQVLVWQVYGLCYLSCPKYYLLDVVLHLPKYLNYAKNMSKDVTSGQPGRKGIIN